MCWYISEKLNFFCSLFIKWYRVSGWSFFVKYFFFILNFFSHNEYIQRVYFFNINRFYVIYMLSYLTTCETDTIKHTEILFHVVIHMILYNISIVCFKFINKLISIYFKIWNINIFFELYNVRIDSIFLIMFDVINLKWTYAASDIHLLTCIIDFDSQVIKYLISSSISIT